MKIRKLLALGIVFACGVQFASAQAYNLDLFFTQSYQQMGPSTSTFQAYYAAERIDSYGTLADPTTATAMRPNGTTDTLTPLDPTQLQYSSATYTLLSDFTTDWGIGTYAFSGNGGLYVGSVDNTGSLWASSPTLATNYAAMAAGLAPGTAFTVNFNPFTGDPGANSATTYIGLYNLTTNAFVDGGGFDPSTTSWTISASDLAPLNSYLLVLDDDNRFDTVGSQPFFQGAGTILSYDTNQNIYFQTVPEPGPFAVVGLGALGLLLRRRNRR